MTWGRLSLLHLFWLYEFDLESHTKGRSCQTLSSLEVKTDLINTTHLQAQTLICDHYVGQHTFAHQFHNGFPATLVIPT